jgi:hypothetical protein
VAILGRQPGTGNVDHQRTLQGSSHKPSLNNAHNPVHLLRAIRAASTTGCE